MKSNKLLIFNIIFFYPSVRQFAIRCILAEKSVLTPVSVAVKK